MSIPHEEVAPGVTCIDVGYVRPRLACCYLLEHDGEFAFIDTGVGPAVDGMLGLLQERGIPRSRVRYIIPTHVHLDHAGGAGQLMRALPQARLVVHPRGARHLVDPSALIAGTLDVYGEERFAELYGEIVPVAEDRVIAAEDGHRLALGGQELEFVDAPGHARHHFVVWDASHKAWFAGDTFGISYREFDRDGRAFLFPTSTPVQFEPDSWRETLQRMLSFAPEQVFLTHFGRVKGVGELAKDLEEGLATYERVARECDGRRDRHALLAARLMDEAVAVLQRKGLLRSREQAEELLGFDMDLNAQGLEVWLDRQRRRPVVGGSQATGR